MSGYCNVESIITSSFVKYKRLNEIIGDMFSGYTDSKLNIYIDLYGVLHSIFSETYRTTIDFYLGYTSTIINMCGHYRSFFKKIGVDTKIYLIFGYNCPEDNIKFVPDYNSRFKLKLENKTIVDMVEANNNILSILCPFLPDIFFLTTKYETSVLIDYLIMKDHKDPSIIISKDGYPAQLTALHDNVGFIKPRKLQGADLSMFIYPRQHELYKSSYSDVLSSMDYRSSKSYIVHPVNYPLMYALSSYKPRSLGTLHNIDMANKIIYNIVGDANIKISVSTIQEKKDSGMKVVPSTVDCRHKSLDVEFWRNIYASSVEAQSITLLNLEDDGSLNMICAEYFKNNPIDLQRLV